MAWFTFSQNNSGGSFVYDEKRGLTHFVVIEAATAAEANARAEAIGLYWDGCDSGRDCECCGDRWYPADGEGDAEPLVYGEPADAVDLWSVWMKPGREIAVHPKSTPIRWYGSAAERPVSIAE